MIYDYAYDCTDDREKSAIGMIQSALKGAKILIGSDGRCAESRDGTVRRQEAGE
ncbi:MAG: hypothetical protein IKP53_08490 [Candidatus Methanomethylophilaceae archaeon]|nr:hypothetical protein [Candidatus Methanomethylophilaceae archaeon]